MKGDSGGRVPGAVGAQNGGLKPMKHPMSFRPDFYFRSVTEIPVSFFRERGVRGVILDIDNTLTADGSPAVSDDVAGWIAGLKRAGLLLCIASNNHNPRVSDFARRLSIPSVSEAGKPSARCFPAILGFFRCAAAETAVVGDQIFTDIWFAKRAGALSVLVRPVGADGFFLIRLKRLLEKPILWGVKRRGK